MLAVCGEDPRTAVRNGRIAVMLQDAGLMPGVTVAELVGLGRRLYPNPLPLADTLELAGLAEVALWVPITASALVGVAYPVDARLSASRVRRPARMPCAASTTWP
jgi:hypothetical protein